MWNQKCANGLAAWADCRAVGAKDPVRYSGFAASIWLSVRQCPVIRPPLPDGIGITRIATTLMMQSMRQVTFDHANCVEASDSVPADAMDAGQVSLPGLQSCWRADRGELDASQ